MWNAWGYNTECRPNHQVVKFLNAIICVPTVSCGYKIVPKNLKVREYKAQTKQILSNVFFPFSHPDSVEHFSLLTSQHGPAFPEVCLSVWYLKHLPFASKVPPDLAKLAGFDPDHSTLWMMSNSMFFSPSAPPAQFALAKFPSKLWPWALKVLIYSNLMHYAKLSAWLKIENH